MNKLYDYIVDYTTVIPQKVNEPFSPESTALRIFFENYYASFSEYKASFSYFQGHPSIILNDGQSTSFNSRYYTSIVFISHFIESIIKGVVYKISPELIKDEVDFAKLFVTSNEEVKKATSISKIFNRLIQLYSTNTKFPKNLKAPSKFKFLVDYKDSIQVLFKLRNDVIHAGTKKLYLYKYDFFIINHIIPILSEYYKITGRKREKPNNVKKNIFNELRKIRLPEDINKDPAETQRLVKRLTHLKSLGYSAMNNPLHSIEFSPGASRKEKKLFAQIVNRANKEKYELMAREYKKQYNGGKIKACLCCGLKTLFLRPWITPESTIAYFDGHCIACNYSVDKLWGDPFDHKIGRAPLFK